MSPVQQQGTDLEYATNLAPVKENIPFMKDGDLVKQAQSGNQRAFEALVERYYIPLHRFTARYFDDYDQRCDVLQQVLIQFYLSLPDLRTDGTVQAWLFRVVRNRCVDELRHKHIPSFSELSAGESDEEVLLSEGASMMTPSVEDQLEQLEEQRYLHQAISDLPQRYRVIVWLRYSTLLTFGEIGRILQIPEATAKTYFQRAKLLLRQSLSQRLD